MKVLFAIMLKPNWIVISSVNVRSSVQNTHYNLAFGSYSISVTPERTSQVLVY